MGEAKRILPNWRIIALHPGTVQPPPLAFVSEISSPLRKICTVVPIVLCRTMDRKMLSSGPQNYVVKTCGLMLYKKPRSSSIAESYWTMLAEKYLHDFLTL